jgi:hypothetical protein
MGSHYHIVEAQGHQIRVSYKERRAAVNLAKECSVPFEDLLVFLQVPDCVLVMPTTAINLLGRLELEVTALNHASVGLSLVKQSSFRRFSAERLLAEFQDRHPLE